MARKMHVKKGDRVLVLSGKDKGKRGKVLEVLPAEGKVIVERVNVVKKHQRPTQKVMQGGIVDIEAPFHASKVMVICSKCSQPTRTGRRRLEDGTRVRVCKKCGEVLD